VLREGDARGGPAVTNFVVAAYYTEGTGYAAEAEKLRASLDALGIDHFICGVPSLVSWQKNTQFKARFVLGTLERYADAPERPLVFVDADAIIHAYPALFDELDADAAFAWRDYALFPSMSSRTRKELLSGTIFLRNNDAVRELVREWIAENERNPAAWEQRNLQTVVARADGKLRIAELPPTYCKIFDIMREAGPAVIEHYQKSRVYRRQVDARPAPFGPGPFVRREAIRGPR
jgi:hypothetical protein